MTSITNTFPVPWRIIDTGSAYRIEDGDKRALAYCYYRSDGRLADIYLTKDRALEMAKAIARMSREP